MTQKSMLSEFM